MNDNDETFEIMSEDDYQKLLQQKARERSEQLKKRSGSRIEEINDNYRRQVNADNTNLSSSPRPRQSWATPVVKMEKNQSSTL